MLRLLRQNHFALHAAVALLIWIAPVVPSHAQTSSMLDPVTTQVAAGALHTCALTARGNVECWGYNYYGQTGGANTASNSPNTSPTQVGGLSNVVAIAAGGDHTCALTLDGAVKCWGFNYNGQLGNSTNAGNANPNPAPLDVSGLGSGVAAITTGGNHTCALTALGGVKCWGDNRYGQLGGSTNINTGTPNPAPADVSGLASGVVAIAAGGDHTCALTTTGGIKCWGYNLSGELGYSANVSTTNPNPTPANVTGLTRGVIAISAGDAHSCALSKTGGMKCWGLNRYGQLGTTTNSGTSTPNPTPANVSGLASGVTAIAAGSDSQTCALTAAGGIKCWGYNYSGELGNGANSGTINPNPTPLDVSGLSNAIAAIAPGGDHVCALTTIGGVRCWGLNRYGQLGVDTNANTSNANPTPAYVTGKSSSPATAVTAGSDHTCAMTAVGGIACWGLNHSGQLGNSTNTGSNNPNPNPADVSNLSSGAAMLAAGAVHTCALTTAGGVKCSGENFYGQLGNAINTGTGNANPMPTDVSALNSAVTAITTGSNHTCALTMAGGVKCWGHNFYGQLGVTTNTGTDSANSTPVAVSGLASGVTAIAAGYGHTCALTNSGGVKCWGRNNWGQLGNSTNSGNNNPNPTPADVIGLTSGVTAIAASSDHTCALTTTGGIECWGANADGELGIGAIDTNRHPMPAGVSGLGSGVARVAAGGNHTCALTTAGAIKCWGFNSHGELGRTDVTTYPTPLDIAGMQSGMVAVVAGDNHICGLTAAGEVDCIGGNSLGQLGSNPTVDSSTPLSVLTAESIAFTPSLRAGKGASMIPSATGGLDGLIQFDSWTPNTCTLTLNSQTSMQTLTFTHTGLCAVRASQFFATGASGGGSVAFAPQQVRLIQVEADLIFASSFESYNGFNN